MYVYIYHGRTRRLLPLHSVSEIPLNKEGGLTRAHGGPKLNWWHCFFRVSFEITDGIHRISPSDDAMLYSPAPLPFFLLMFFNCDSLSMRALERAHKFYCVFKDSSFIGTIYFCIHFTKVCTLHLSFILKSTIVFLLHWALVGIYRVCLLSCVCVDLKPTTNSSPVQVS